MSSDQVQFILDVLPYVLIVIGFIMALRWDYVTNTRPIVVTDITKLTSVNTNEVNEALPEAVFAAEGSNK